MKFSDLFIFHFRLHSFLLFPVPRCSFLFAAATEHYLGEDGHALGDVPFRG